MSLGVYFLLIFSEDLRRIGITSLNMGKRHLGSHMVYRFFLLLGDYFFFSTHILFNFISYYFFQFSNYFIVVQLQLSAFSPHPSTPPQLNPPPSLESTLPRFCPSLLYSSSWKPYFWLSLPPSQQEIVRLLLTSMSLFFFLWLIMLHLKVRSYDICLSPPGLFHLA